MTVSDELVQEILEAVPAAIVNLQVYQLHYKPYQSGWNEAQMAIIDLKLVFEKLRKEAELCGKQQIQY